MAATTLTDQPATGRFFLGFGAGALLALAGVLALTLFLVRSGETSSYATVVQEQLPSDAVFAPASSFDYVTYKLEMVRQAQPEILVVGSSRAAGFQGKYFRPSFINGGLAVRSIEQAQQFADRIFEFSKPKVVILTLDFWWFLPNVRRNDPAPLEPGIPAPGMAPDLLKLPISAVLKGQLTPRQLIAVTLLGDRSNTITNYENIGVGAISNSNGVRADGSQLYAEYALRGRAIDYRFELTAEQIAAGTSGYTWSETVDEAAFDNLKALIRSLQARGVRVAGFLPPVSPTVFRLMNESGKYRYIGELRRRLGEFGIPIADFHDPQSIPATDCEFVDGYHGGDITYLKMLRTMARDWDWLRPMVDAEAASATIADFDGNIIDQSDGDKFNGRPEVDFLGMGCTRRPSRPG